MQLRTAARDYYELLAQGGRPKLDKGLFLEDLPHLELPPVGWLCESPTTAMALMHVRCPLAAEAVPESQSAAPSAIEELLAALAHPPSQNLQEAFPPATASSAAPAPSQFAAAALVEPWTTGDAREERGLGKRRLDWGLSPTCKLIQEATQDEGGLGLGYVVDGGSMDELAELLDEQLGSWTLTPDLMQGLGPEEFPPCHVPDLGAATGWLNSLLLEEPPPQAEERSTQLPVLSQSPSPPAAEEGNTQPLQQPSQATNKSFPGEGSVQEERSSPALVWDAMDELLTREDSDEELREEAWLQAPVLPPLPGLLEEEELLQLQPGKCSGQVEVPRFEELLGCRPQEEEEQGHERADVQMDTDVNDQVLTAAQLQDVLLPLPTQERELDDPTSVDWLDHVPGVRTVSLLDLKVAGLPSLWELEDVLSNDALQPLPLSLSIPQSACWQGSGEDREKAAEDASERFYAGCWCVGSRRQAIEELQVPVALEQLPVPEEVAALLPGSRATRAEATEEGGGVLKFLGEILGADSLHDGETDAEASQGFLNTLEALRGPGSDTKLLPARRTGGKASERSSTAAPTDYIQELWPTKRTTPSGTGNGHGPTPKPAWTRLSSFKALGQLPQGLLASSRPQCPSSEDSRKDAEGPTTTTGTEKGGAAQEVVDHRYECAPEEHSLAEQLLEGMDLAWAAYRSHGAAAPELAATAGTCERPSGAELRGLLQRHADQFQHAGGGELEGMLAATLELDLYRVLLGLHVLSVLHEELITSGALQAAFCADALLEHYPSFLLSENHWTDKTIRQLHHLLHAGPTQVGRDPSERVNLSGSEWRSGPARLCAYASCPGCRLTSRGPEGGKAQSLLELKRQACARGRRLAVLFASEALLEIVAESVGQELGAVALGVLTPATQTILQLRRADSALLHETLVAPADAQAGTAPSHGVNPSAMAVGWEIRRLLRRGYLVVAYQPLVLSVASALVSIRLVPVPPKVATACRGTKRHAAVVRSQSEEPPARSGRTGTEAHVYAYAQKQVQSGAARSGHSPGVAAAQPQPPLALVVGEHLKKHKVLVRAFESAGITLVERRALAPSLPDFLLGPRSCGLLRSLDIFAKPAEVQELVRVVHETLISFDEIMLVVVVGESAKQRNEENLDPVADFLQMVRTPCCLPEGKLMHVLYSPVHGLPALVRAELQRWIEEAPGWVSDLFAQPETAQEAFLAELPGLNAHVAQQIASRQSVREFCALDAVAMRGHPHYLGDESTEVLQAALDYPCAPAAAGHTRPVAWKGPPPADRIPTVDTVFTPVHRQAPAVLGDPATPRPVQQRRPRSSRRSPPPAGVTAPPPQARTEPLQTPPVLRAQAQPRQGRTSLPAEAQVHAEAQPRRAQPAEVLPRHPQPAEAPRQARLAEDLPWPAQPANAVPRHPQPAEAPPRHAQPAAAPRHPQPAEAPPRHAQPAAAPRHAQPAAVPRRAQAAQDEAPPRRRASSARLLHPSEEVTGHAWSTETSHCDRGRSARWEGGGRHSEPRRGRGVTWHGCEEDEEEDAVHSRRQEERTHAPAPPWAQRRREKQQQPWQHREWLSEEEEERAAPHADPHGARYAARKIEEGALFDEDWPPARMPSAAAAAAPHSGGYGPHHPLRRHEGRACLSEEEWPPPCTPTPAAATTNARGGARGARLPPPRQEEELPPPCTPTPAAAATNACGGARGVRLPPPRQEEQAYLSEDEPPCTPAPQHAHVVDDATATPESVAMPHMRRTQRPQGAAARPPSAWAQTGQSLPPQKRRLFGPDSSSSLFSGLRRPLLEPRWGQPNSTSSQASQRARVGLGRPAALGASRVGRGVGRERSLPSFDPWHQD